MKPSNSQKDKKVSDDTEVSNKDLQKEIQRLKEEKRQIEVELERYRICFESSPSGLLIEEDDGTIIEVNSTHCLALGYPREELIGKKIHMLAHEDIRPTVEANLKRIMEGEFLRHTVRTEHPSGRPCYTVLNERKIPLGDGRNGILVASIDVTELKKKEQELEASEQRNKAILNALPDMLFIADHEHHYLELHRGDFPLHLPEDLVPEIIGKTPTDLGVPTEYMEKFNKAVKKIRTGSRCESFEFSSLRKTGTAAAVREFEVRITSLAGDRVLGIVREITKAKSAERNLRTALDRAESASRAKARFLANMSHEIRTPINGILGMTELFSETELSEVQKEYLNIIHDSSEVLLSLIRDILDLSRIEENFLELEEIDFDTEQVFQTIISIIRPKCDQKNLHFHTHIDSGISKRLKGDPTRIRQVLLNLLSNAVKFSEEGSITLRICEKPDSASDPKLFFSVADTGIGISPEKQEVIFDAFTQAETSTTRQYGGSGLGLSISSRIVSLMGGELKVVSEMGKGAEFKGHITLKHSDSSTRDLETGDSDYDQIDLSKIRIMIVEDNFVNAEILKRILLKYAPQKIDTVVNGKEAVDSCRDNIYDLIFMDCQMPVMDGYEASREIRTMAPMGETIIIALTANAIVGESEKCLAAGMNDYLTKPLRKNELYDAFLRTGIITKR